MNNGTIKYIYWQDDNFWLGYFEDYPDYVTQGESLKELKENLEDIYGELIGGKIPNARKIARLKLKRKNSTKRKVN